MVCTIITHIVFQVRINNNKNNNNNSNNNNSNSNKTKLFYSSVYNLSYV